MPEARPAPAFLDELSGALDPGQIMTDPAIRLRHGHGHTVSEINAVRTSGFPRVPDYVLFPKDEAQVSRDRARRGSLGVVLMPYGGGTNVTEALRCLPMKSGRSSRSTCARLDRIDWIDPVNRMA